MPNLVGIGLNQVPTNSMLGGLAYQDPEHASIKNLDLKNLSQINSEIADTATDVFVYDTSKDSDGGAWRKRTTHTTWYNETLGTATRGTRKEFPAVAVIVVTEDDVIIYDGDDPDLPMWMIFESSDTGTPYDTHYLGRGSGFSGFHPSITSVAMLNGILVVGKDGDASNYAEAYTEIRFISDRALHRDQTSAADMGNAISGRNGSAGGRLSNSSYGGLAHFDLHDIAMTVLPNAPIDDATGLPVPTIAVATDGGTSVIKDDGTVVDFNDSLGSTRPVSTVAIRGNDIVHWNVNNGTLQQFFDALNATSDSTNDVKYNYTAGGGHATCENVSALLRTAGDTPYYLAVRDSKSIAAAAQSGMSVFVDGFDRSFNTNNHSIFDSRVAYVTSDYNTGWMHGDIKGAFLSDTDATNVTGSELVSNYDFTSGTTNWAINLNGGVGGASITASSNQLVFTQGTNSVWLEAYQDITTVSGEKYVVDFEIASSNTNANWRIVVAGTTVIGYPTGLGQGHHSYTFTASSTTTRVSIQQGGGSGVSGTAESLSVRIAEQDRSVNNNGLQVFGTITKTPVATGAELVAYSGFDSGNYLRYNASDMAFGTGDFSVSLWCIPSTDASNEFILELDDASSAGGNRFYFLTTNTATKRLYLPWDSDVAGSDLTPGQWNHIVVGRNLDMDLFM